MADDALPCIRCDKPLKNVDPEYTPANQPYEGTAFTTSGHYGSTVFDPMDGTIIEINVCDECLKSLQGTGKVFHRQARKPVVIDHVGFVGWLRTPDREYTVWTGDETPGDDDRLIVEVEDIGSDIYPEIEWTKGALAYKKDHDAKKERS